MKCCKAMLRVGELAFLQEKLSPIVSTSVRKQHSSPAVSHELELQAHITQIPPPPSASWCTAHFRSYIVHSVFRRNSRVVMMLLAISALQVLCMWHGNRTHVMSIMATRVAHLRRVHELSFEFCAIFKTYIRVILQTQMSPRDLHPCLFVCNASI